MQLANERLTIQSSAAGDVGQTVTLIGSEADSVVLDGTTPVQTSKTFAELSTCALSAVAAGTVTVKRADGSVVLDFRPGETERPADVVQPGLTTVRSQPKALYGEPGFEFGAANLNDFSLTERHTVELDVQPLAFGTPHPLNSRLLLMGQKLTDGETGKRIHVRVYAARLEAADQAGYGYSVSYPYALQDFPKVQWTLRIAKSDYEGMEFAQTCLVEGYSALELVEENFAVDAVAVFGTLTLGFEKIPGPQIISEGFDERGDLEQTVTQTVRNDDDPPVEQMNYLVNEANKTGVDGKRATSVVKTVAQRSPLFTEDAFTTNRTLMRHITGVRRITRQDVVPVGTPADTGFFVVESSVKDQNKWKAVKNTMRVDRFLTLVSTDVDPAAHGAKTTTTESIVPAGTYAAGVITITGPVTGPGSVAVGGADGFAYSVVADAPPESARSLADYLAGVINGNVYEFTAVAAGNTAAATLTITARLPGEIGNAIALSVTGACFAGSGGTLDGGAATLPDPMDVNTLVSNVGGIDGTHSLKTLKKLAAGETWPTLVSKIPNREKNVVEIIERTKVAAGSVTAGAVIIPAITADGVTTGPWVVVTSEEEIEGDKSKAYKVVRTTPQSPYTSTSPHVTEKSEAKTFPALLNFTLNSSKRIFGYNFFAASADVVPATIETYYVIGDKPMVEYTPIIPGSVTMGDGGSITNVLHDGAVITNTIDGVVTPIVYAATTPSYSEYKLGTITGYDGTATRTIIQNGDGTGSDNVVGVGTHFTTDFANGQTIYYGANGAVTINHITDDTHFSVVHPVYGSAVSTTEIPCGSFYTIDPSTKWVGEKKCVSYEVDDLGFGKEWRVRRVLLEMR